MSVRLRRPVFDNGGDVRGQEGGFVDERFGALGYGDKILGGEG